MWLIFSLLAVVFFIIICNIIVVVVTKGRNIQHLEPMPRCTWGIVLGTGPMTSSGYVNNHYLTRVETAANAFQYGIISNLIISGGGQEECEVMFNDLVNRKVSADRIYCDYEGFNTYSSIRNIRHLHLSTGRSECSECYVIITQRLYAFRALFIALCMGLDAVAYAPGFQKPAWNMIWPVIRNGKPAVFPREWLARTKAVIQVLPAKMFIYRNKKNRTKKHVGGFW